MKDYARSRAWCEWSEFDQWREQALAALSDSAAAPLPPFHLLSLPGISPAQQRLAGERWMAPRLLASELARARATAEFGRSTRRGHEAGLRQGLADAALLAEPEVLEELLQAEVLPGSVAVAAAADALVEPQLKLRLGYLSSDFRQHATALLMIELLEAHDRDRFEWHAYSHGADDGLGMRQRVAACFDGFHDISALDDEQTAHAIHADGIDILIDLKGYTAASRTAVLSYRAAPIQVSFLGYPGTLGGDFCDYLLTDAFVTPPGAASDYSEALACLPNSYQPHARHVAPGLAPSRAEAGLPEQGLVFCCFNQAWKFTPEVFRVWCLLLAQVPESVLWLLADKQAEGNLRTEAIRWGVDPQRLVFAPDLAQAAHLARLPLADLVLDTSPYNAHTTASDALGAGVPLITWAGETFASRVAGSLLHAVGLPELVCESLEAYADLALELACEPERLAALRAKLAAQAPTAALFDVPRYARDLEGLFEAMWARHLSGQAPGPLNG